MIDLILLNILPPDPFLQPEEVQCCRSCPPCQRPVRSQARLQPDYLIIVIFLEIYGKNICQRPVRSQARLQPSNEPLVVFVLVSCVS